jgi:catechol 2,3-dioxygenase-like lactoylglutathione lyase family enzyme
MAFRINHLHLKTPDPKKTADFYIEYTGAKNPKHTTRPNAAKTILNNIHADSDN